MSIIRHVEKLTEILDRTAMNEFASVIKRVDFDRVDLECFMSWRADGYTRNCLAKTDAYELILLCWEPGAKTSIHDHGGEDCWVYQLEGTISEFRYEEGEAGTLVETQQLDLKPGKLTFMNDEMGYHSISNLSDERALTLHVYASPIDSCNVYNQEQGCFQSKDLFYDTFLNESVSIPS